MKTLLTFNVAMRREQRIEDMVADADTVLDTVLKLTAGDTVPMSTLMLAMGSYFQSWVRLGAVDGDTFAYEGSTGPAWLRVVCEALKRHGRGVKYEDFTLPGDLRAEATDEELSHV